MDPVNNDVVNIQPSASTFILTQLIPGTIKLPLQVFDNLNIKNAPEPIHKPDGDTFGNLPKIQI